MILTGLVALLLPGREVLGSGLHFIGEAIAEDITLSLKLMFALLFLKLLATSFTLGAGNSGGILAPTLFMGATLGGIVGTIAHILWPTVAINPGAYAIVGMAALFSGAARAPITSILIVFEMSGDYKLILPLMLATVLSTLVAEVLFSDSIYTLRLTLKGINLQSGRDEDVLRSVLVEEVMSQQIEIVSTESTLVEISEILARTRVHGLPVLDHEGLLWGLVTVTDLDQAVLKQMPRSTPVIQFGMPRSRLLVAYPDESIGEALERMSLRGVGRMPVVSKENPNHLVGLVRRSDIIRAYNVALTRRKELQHRTKRAQLHNLDGTEFVDLALADTDIAVGKSIYELAPQIPDDCVLVSVRRDGRILIPHGDTRLRDGDHITAFVRSQDVATLFACLHGQPEEPAEAPTKVVGMEDEAESG